MLGDWTEIKDKTKVPFISDAGPSTKRRYERVRRGKSPLSHNIISLPMQGNSTKGGNINWINITIMVSFIIEYDKN